MRSPRPVAALLAVIAAAAAAALAAPGRSQAQNLTPPFVRKPIVDFSVPAGMASSAMKLKKTFALQGVGAGPFVRFTTTQGTLDVELRPDAAPQTVTNFLNYVNRGAYDGSFLHRSVPGFIIQGGGFRFVTNGAETVPADPPVVNEFNLSNLRGTIAMAKLGGDPDSATSQWFFNESDSNAANLDNQNGGFTVFGSLITNGQSVMDTLAALPLFDSRSEPFRQVPVVNYVSGDITGDNLVTVNTVRALPLVPVTEGQPSLLKLAVAANTNPGLVSATITGQRLLLAYTPGATGSATITIRAKSVGAKAKAVFTVTVR